MRNRFENFFVTLYRGTKSVWKKYHFLIPPRLWKKYAKLLLGIPLGASAFMVDPFNRKGYSRWLNKNEKRPSYHKLDYQPLISILVPVYNANAKFLTECIESVLNQHYQNFELCLVDDASTSEETLAVLKSYSDNPKIKIKYRKENGHISRASNDALKLAKGEFVALLDNDDTLAENALYEVAKVLNKDKKIDFIYSDEDKLDLKGRRCEPHFKPDWSPDTLLSLNYICHLAVMRRTILNKLNGFTVGLEGAQDYDLFLRFTEQTDRIYHISKILYHWRMSEGSTSMNLSSKEYASDKGKIAIENALKRRGISGHVKKDTKSSYYQVFYDYEKEPKVSIIIPTRDHATTTETCLKSIFKKTSYHNFEVIVANNNSKEPETFKLFEKYQKKYDNFRVINVNEEFNYSRINNLAIKESQGDVVILLNNDTEIITPEWLTVLVGYAMRPHIGAVGPKLLYPDSTVQHAGVILGLGGVASHAYIGASRDDLGIFGRLRVPYDYGAVTAACLCVEKQKYLKVGGLNESLKVAYNDIDFNIRLREAGYYNVEVPMVELFHFESKSRGQDTSPEKKARFNRESKYMWKNWKKQLLNDEFYNSNFTKRIWFMLDKDEKYRPDKNV